MKNVDFLFLITLYDKKIIDSIAVNTLLEHLAVIEKYSFNVVIRDNTHSKDQAFIDLPPYCYYWHDGKNSPLSMVYNHVVKSNNFRYFINLDDDTEISSEYLLSLSKLPNSHSRVAAFPNVYHSKTRVSPGNYFLTKGFKRYAFQKNKVFKPFFMAITSGSIVGKDVFSITEYNENLTLYGIDTEFILTLRKVNSISILILDSSLNHMSALKTKSSRHDSSVRLNNRFNAWRHIHPKGIQRVIIELRIFLNKRLIK